MSGDGGNTVPTGRQAEILDGLVDGSVTLPPMEALRLSRPTSWEPGRVAGEWVVDPAMFHTGGAVFGGYLAALCDNACAYAVRSILADDEGYATADLGVTFLRPVRGGRLRWEATVAHRGKRIAYVEATFTDDDGLPAVKSRAVQLIVPTSGG